MNFDKLIKIKKSKSKIIYFILLTILIFLVFLIFNADASQDANMLILPISGSYPVGTILSVDVYVSSLDQEVNAISGIVDFPTDELEVISITKLNSFIDFWVQEPSFSNSDGHVYFEGIVLNSAFIGSRGKVLSVNFKTKSSGTALVSFSYAAILASDGLGTNIFKESNSALFSIQEPQPIVSSSLPQQQSSGGQIFSAPTAPVIFSSTHPNQDKWYSQTTAKLSWVVPSDISSIGLLIDKKAGSAPSIVYSPPVNNKEISNLDDGIWYFHSQFKNNGGWGEINHYRIKIDTQPPKSLNAEFLEGDKTDNSNPTIILSSIDDVSGIDYYKITINGNSLVIYPKDLASDNSYVLPNQSAGNKKVLIEVFDKAGNLKSIFKEITIKTTDAPVIEEYPEEVEKENPLTIKGNANFDNADIIVLFRKGNEYIKSNKVKANESGEFTLVLPEGLEEGVYSVWAERQNKQGLLNFLSEEVIINVKGSSIIDFVEKSSLFISIILSILVLYILFCMRSKRRKIRVKEIKN